MNRPISPRRSREGYEQLVRAQPVVARSGAAESAADLMAKIAAQDEGLAAAVASIDWAGSPHDCLGPLWESTRSIADRRSGGQFFTGVDPIDLIVAWCVRSPDDVVLDPACGSGAFLVRALARISSLAERATVAPAMGKLIGVEVDRGALCLAECNLLARRANFHLRHGDFFSLRPGDLPAPSVAIGNPPYTRQELLSGAKARSARAVADDWHLDPMPGRAGLHVPFLMHALAFLPQGGRLGMLISNSWLNAGYGGPLRRLLLEQCCVEAIVEPADERWFAAAVNPAIVIARRELRAATRADHVVSFARLKRPLATLIGSPPAGDDRWAAVEALNACIENPAGRDGLRVARVAQRDLGQEAWTAAGDAPRTRAQQKWWGYLGGSADVARKLAPFCRRLADFADIRRGLTTGANAFFYVQHDSPHHGPAGQDELSTITAGDGSRHEIESRFLRPIVTSSREIAGLHVEPAGLRRRVVLLPPDPAQLAGTMASQYLRWGEDLGFAARVTCRARRRWWSLRPAQPGALLWCKTHYARHLAPLNSGALADCNLYHVVPHAGVDALLLAVALNSAVAALFKELHGRSNLGEGALKTEVCDVLGLPIPDLDRLGIGFRREVVLPLLERPTLPWAREQTQPDRRLLDATILAALGFPDPDGLSVELYDAVTEAVEERLSRRSSGSR